MRFLRKSLRRGVWANTGVRNKQTRCGNKFPARSFFTVKPVLANSCAVFETMKGEFAAYFDRKTPRFVIRQRNTTTLGAETLHCIEAANVSREKRSFEDKSDAPPPLSSAPSILVCFDGCSSTDLEVCHCFEVAMQTLYRKYVSSQQGVRLYVCSCVCLCVFVPVYMCSYLCMCVFMCVNDTVLMNNSELFSL